MPETDSPPNPSTDWSSEMAAVTHARDRDSFMHIYDHFMPRLCIYLRGIGASGPVAEELAQEAMFRLWERAASYDPSRSAVSTWLFRIARNLHIDRLRRQPAGAFVPEEVIDLEMSDDAVSSEDYVDRMQVRRHLRALSPVQGRLIRMSYFEAKSHRDISDELDMPLGTVKSHLRRALLRLQGQVGEEE